jgi:High potential iron-sulfur protein
VSGGSESPNQLASKSFLANPARRGILRAAASLAGSLALMPFLGFRDASAQKKLKTQEEVKYQPTPKGKQTCANCDLFVKPDKCKSVEGTVAPEGWCKIWVAY